MLQGFDQGRNEMEVRQWTQLWLWKKDKSYVSFLPPLGLEFMTVNSLIDHENNSWRMDIAAQILNEDDMNDLQMVPLTNTHDSDRPCWKYSAHGKYTVRSAYHHLMDNMICNENLKVKGNWKLVWQLPLPPKVKHFLWRTLKCCLPTRTRLQSKGKESIARVFFGCQQVRNVWEEAGI